ncbi:MAG: Ig-like domain-containing protein, partial [Betaproteobacteria bacterium]|nr:Ig-like domain-containing protein [Betaproteobacteria bacterium]
MNPDQIVAAINSVKGQAFALGPDGESRPLTDGAPLYDGEILVADPDSQVEVAHEDGSPPYQVDGPMQLAMSDVPMADEAEITPEALEELLNNFDPPEFGGGGGSRPHNLVMLERILEPVEPATNEYDTTPLRGEGPYDWFNLSLSLGSGGGGGGGTPPQPSPQALDDYYQVREGSFTTPTALVGSVLQNDDGNTVIMIRLNGVEYNVPAGADGLTFWTALGGGVLITQDGHFVYAAPVVDNSNGPVIDSFEYCSTMDANGNPIWTTVHIDITDTIPVAVDDFYGEESFGPGVRFSANVMDNDDPSLDGVNYVWKVRQGDGETEFSVPQHSGMMPVLITANGGAVWINQDGSFSYQPSTSFMGEDTFQYQLNDSDGSPSNWATVTFNVPGP